MTRRLTAYFDERQRGADGFVADSLLDMFAERAVADSVVLRGIAGFGPRHELRTDRALSASEDLPLVLTAVDTDERITALAEQVVGEVQHGLVTLEQVTDAPHGECALSLQLRRHDRFRDVTDLLHRHGFLGAAVYLGVDGTVRGRRQRARFFGANTEVPLLVDAVGTAEKVAAVRSALPTAVVRPVQVCKRDGVLLGTPIAWPATDPAGRPIWQRLTIHTDEATRRDGVPIHRGIVDALRERGTGGGVTVLRGVWGFHGAHRPHGDRLFRVARRVPVTTVLVDTPDRIARCFDIVDTWTGTHGLVISEVVPAAVSIDSGRLLGGTAFADTSGA
ncbi:DUF190 domain-containing protein [Mycobacterium sp. NPDC003323]